MPSGSIATQDISIAHSPDSDDAFMFYGLATNKVRVPGYRFTHVLTDIETLNHKAINEAFYDVTAISFHAYPYLQEKYTLMPCGGSVGEGYGPMIVSPRKLTTAELKKTRIAIPGTLTTAYLTLKLYEPEIETSVVPFDKIIPAVLSGEFDAGLIIHEGQFDLREGGSAEAARSGPVVERANLPAPAARWQCDSEIARNGSSTHCNRGTTRQHPACARSSRRSSPVCNAVRAGVGYSYRKQVCRDVCATNER